LSYFSDLNYSLANEDTTVEYEMVKRLGFKDILAVTGSGARSLPFLALNPTTLKVVDVAGAQLAFARFKELSLRKASRPELLAFWNGDLSDERREALIRQWAAPEMDPAPLLHWLSQNPGVAPLYWGKWEKTFMTFSKVAAVLLGKDRLAPMFKNSDPGAYFRRELRGWRWNLLLKIVGNRSVFNSLLYKGSFIAKNDPRSFVVYYRESFDQLMALDVRLSHFAQLCFAGRVVLEEGLPIEFREDVRQAISGSSSQVEYAEESLLAADRTDRFDFVSLSDVPCYFTGETEKTFWQDIRKKLRPGGVAVARYYLRRPENMDLRGFIDVTEEWKFLWDKELVQMYQFHILKRQD
jgi:S-adenosylmethionine-diacylglycerol 3-amino-3-carboxypropyl transferase